ncbi:transposase family protein, partial [uncultured Thiothrix sp.]|uniref:transposase family protein n=1 Tax=uncultured Thiothrix sp. TaxID=223185 RepID=UPI00262BE728
IQHLAVAQQHEHDLTLARQQPPRLAKNALGVVDLGYQGLALEGCRVVWPFKKPKTRQLEPEEKAFNQRVARLRVKVEHRIRSLKIFRLLKGVYRGRRRRFERQLRLIAGLVNRMILQ